MSPLPQQQRVAAYAVIVRDGQLLLSRLAPHVSNGELWTLPGGGVDHGEHPRDAVIREIREETGLEAWVGDTARIYSAHMPGVWRGSARVDAHAVRIVYDGWVAADAGEPRVVEVDGSTVDAAWVPLRDIESGTIPVTAMVREVLAAHEPQRLQRTAAYALVRRGGTVLLTRLSERSPHPGLWTLPGGGIDHGEAPATALAREVREECGIECQVGELLDVHDWHFSGTAPSGQFQDFHGIHLIFAASVAHDAEPHVAEASGSTDAVAWVPLSDIDAGTVPVLDLVRAALATTAED